MLENFERVETTFHMDFAIAEKFGIASVKDTYNRAFKEWKSNYKYLTELVLAVNERCWYWYYNGRKDLSEIYSEMYHKGNDFANETLRGEEAEYYYRMTD